MRANEEYKTVKRADNVGYLGIGRWDNIKMDHTDVWFWSADCNHLADDRAQRGDLVETEIYFRVK